VHLLLPAAGDAGCSGVRLLRWLLPQLLPGAHSLSWLVLLVVLLLLVLLSLWCCLNWVQLACVGRCQPSCVGVCSGRACWNEPGGPEG
jgi:hypothetical protein